jgi:hypothetical protein
MVADQVGIDALGLQQLGQRVVERLERAPAAVHEVEPAGVQVAPRRHAGQAADIVAVKSQRARGEAVEIGRLDPRPAIGPERQAVERIEQHEHGFHRRPSPLSAAWAVQR